ncbi:MAG: hypothetical protein IKV03_03395 [Alphaproteobacteria bacterium]|nr:hypothetical protein [Alphaproteobacteria bacterium]
MTKMKKILLAGASITILVGCPFVISVAYDTSHENGSKVVLSENEKVSIENQCDFDLVCMICEADAQGYEGDASVHNAFFRLYEKDYSDCEKGILSGVEYKVRSQHRLKRAKQFESRSWRDALNDACKNHTFEDFLMRHGRYEKVSPENNQIEPCAIYKNTQNFKGLGCEYTR